MSSGFVKVLKYVSRAKFISPLCTKVIFRHSLWGSYRSSCEGVTTAEHPIHIQLGMQNNSVWIYTVSQWLQDKDAWHQSWRHNLSFNAQTYNRHQASHSVQAWVGYCNWGHPASGGWVLDIGRKSSQVFHILWRVRNILLKHQCPWWLYGAISNIFFSWRWPKDLLRSLEF